MRMSGFRLLYLHHDISQIQDLAHIYIFAKHYSVFRQQDHSASGSGAYCEYYFIRQRPAC